MLLVFTDLPDLHDLLTSLSKQLICDIINQYQIVHSGPRPDHALLFTYKTICVCVNPCHTSFHVNEPLIKDHGWSFSQLGTTS